MNTFIIRIFSDKILTIYISLMYSVPIVTVSAAVSVLGSVLEVATMVME